MTEIEVTITQPTIEVKFESTLNTGGGGGAVDSVNGQTGVVVLTTTNIEEGTNQYFTDARAIAALASTLLDYVTTTALNTALSAYVTAVSLASTLANYVTNSSLATTLTNYVTNSSLATTLLGYATTLELADKQDKRIVVSSNTTAVIDGAYTLVASATFTDPTPVEGKGFSVLIRNGTATIGGITYSTAGTTVWRVFHSGSWANYVNQLSLGFTPENVANKSTTTTLGSSDTLYPTQNAVKTYVDNLSSKIANIDISVTESSTSANATEVLLRAIPITANTIANGDWLYLTSLISTSQTTGNISIFIRIGTSANPASISSETLISSILNAASAAGGRFQPIDTHLVVDNNNIKTANNLTIMNQFNGVQVAATALPPLNATWYIYISASKSVAGGTITFFGNRLTRFRT